MNSNAKYTMNKCVKKSKGLPSAIRAKFSQHRTDMWFKFHIMLNSGPNLMEWGGGVCDGVQMSRASKLSVKDGQN